MPAGEVAIMKQFVHVVFLVLVFTILCVWSASAQGLSDGSPADSSAAATFDEIALLFAPLAAAATGIERSLEMLWNWFEGLFINLVALIAMGRKWAKWAGDEVSHAHRAVGQVAADLARLRRSETATVSASPRAESALARAMRDAEAQLQLAESRMTGVLKNDRYRQFKSATSVLAGVAMGVIIAFTAKLKMFGLLGVEGVPAGVDMFVTGFVMGTGAAPMHSLIGILQSGKDALAGASQLLQGRYLESLSTARQTSVSTTRAAEGLVPSDSRE
jgi:hypothetical protein